jgi:alkanesulfonate monooxygenase SsuD/methylene tetrahydromethanopterin reductase-like flavin-dependent oxidoreductase (luciferase family)
VSIAMLRDLWHAADELGFGWISVWDHFVPVLGDGDNHEAVAMHAALALSTKEARVGCLVYNTGYRSAAVLAKAASTLDHLSNGRAVIGLGAGYLQREYEQFGIPFGTPAQRSDLLESSTHDVRRLLDSVVQPRPMQQKLPLWIGGGGEKRTLPLTARIADGWNIPMASPTDWAHKNVLLSRLVADAGRAQDDVERSVSVGLSFDESDIPQRFGSNWPQLRPSILTGNPDNMIDHIDSYVAAGADTIILSLRPPYSVDEIERFAKEIMGHYA